MGKGGLRKYASGVAVAAAVLAWAIAFASSSGDPEWTGLWGAPRQTRGNAIAIQGKPIETPAERERRIAQRRNEISDALQDLRKDLLGDGRKTRGSELHVRQRVPASLARYTQRDVCMQMRLEFPDRFGNLDCMSDEYDDNDPWFKASPRSGR